MNVTPRAIGVAIGAVASIKNQLKEQDNTSSSIYLKNAWFRATCVKVEGVK